MFNYLPYIGGPTGFTDTSTRNVVFAYFPTIAEQGYVEAHELGRVVGLSHRDVSDPVIWIMHSDAGLGSDHFNRSEADAYDFP